MEQKKERKKDKNIILQSKEEEACFEIAKARRTRHYAGHG